MESHSTQEPPAPSRPWVPLLLIFATLLVAGLLCSDALARLAPDPGIADTDIRPGIAAVTDAVPVSGETARDALVVDAPAGSTEVASPPAEDAVTAPVVEVAALETAGVPDEPGSATGGQSNGNTNPNAHPNGHTNSGQSHGANHGNQGNNGNGHGRP